MSLKIAKQAKHYIPRHCRTEVKTMFEFDRFYDYRLVRMSRTDPTRELNYTPDHWMQHKSVWRRIRHVLTVFGSSPLQRLFFPDFLVTASVAGGLTYYNEIIAPDTSSQLFLDGIGVFGGTTAIGLMVAFRLNASYGRFQEGRQSLGGINNSSRNLASNSLMWLDQGPEQTNRMLKLIKAFPVALHWHLNVKGGHYRIHRWQPDFQEQLSAEYHAEVLDIFQNPENDDFLRIFQAYESKAHVPLVIASLMREIVAKNGEHSEHSLNRELDRHIQDLVNYTGMCERILRTPIPTCFTRHTSRLLFLWSNTLPFAFYGVCGPHFTLPASLVVSYAMLGIEDIGVQLEEPFNILPLRQYSEGVYDGVETIDAAYRRDDHTTD